MKNTVSNIATTVPGARFKRLERQRVPRDVFCVIEDSYRDRAVAEEVCHGRFTHAGVTLEVGGEIDKTDWPDWGAADFPGDKEWRIEHRKFYYGLALAHAFCETGDGMYLRVWEQLVQSWIRHVPVGFDTSDATGRRIQNWIYAWNAFASSPRFTGFVSELEDRIVASLADQVQHLRHHLTDERNHRTLELYALFIAALALPEIDVEGDLLDFATREIHRNLLTDVRPDGVHREHSTHYHMIVLRSFVGALENARRFNLALPEGYQERLERACEFALHCHRPDGQIPALSDSDTGAHTDVLALAGSLLSRPDFLYGATAGALGAAPKQRYVSFPDGGYFIQRSGWGEGETPFQEERFLIFDCGAIGDGGHGHYDLLNVEIAAGGRPLVIDPGRYSYSEQEPNWRRWFKGTAAHNTICVDGLDQTPYRPGKPRKRTVAQGRFNERLSAPGFDVLCGEARSAAYDALHTRRIFFTGEYWIICDHLRSASPHRYDLRFHLPPAVWNHTASTLAETNAAVRTPDFALVFAPARDPIIEPGWFAPKYGVKLQAPVVSVIADGVAQADFHTLVVPLDLKDALPSFQVYVSESGASPITTFEIKGVGRDKSATDHVVWSTSCESFVLDEFHCRASAAFLRASAGGKVDEFRACNVEELSVRTTGGEKRFFSDALVRRWVMWNERQGFVQDDGREL